MSDFYILNDGHEPVSVPLQTWARWLEDDPRRRQVADSDRDGIRVSTVFLGVDHRFGGGTPILFETMIFGGPNDQWQDRCSTWDEAVAMHETACRLAFPTH